jgi:hypothetical protein
MSESEVSKFIINFPSAETLGVMMKEMGVQSIVFHCGSLHISATVQHSDRASHLCPIESE